MKTKPKLMFSALTQKIYIVIGKEKFDVTKEAEYFVKNKGKIQLIP